MKPNRKLLRYVAEWCEKEEGLPYGGRWEATLAGAETAETDPNRYAAAAYQKAQAERYARYYRLYSIPAWVAATFVSWGYTDRWTVDGVSIYDAARRALGVDGDTWTKLINANNRAADVRRICEQAT